MVKIVKMLAVCVMLLCACSLFAAQSTVDVTASDKLKKEAMQKILKGSGETPATEEEYLIGNGDILEIEVYGEGSMAIASPGAQGGGDTTGLRGADRGVQVRIDGRISLKHIGEVNAVGLTLTQLADYLKILYGTIYGDPIVTVVLVQSNSKRYTVMGKVVNPGIYYLDFPIDLVQVVARSGGFTDWANSKMTVVRDGAGKTNHLFKGNTLSFDYDNFLKGVELEKNIAIKPGDIIIIH